MEFISDMKVTNKHSTHMCMWSMFRPFPRSARCKGLIHTHKARLNQRYLCQLMSEVYYDVENEPKLQSLQGTSFAKNLTTSDEDNRLDVKANGLLGSRFSRSFFDVKVLRSRDIPAITLLSLLICVPGGFRGILLPH